MFYTYWPCNLNKHGILHLWPADNFPCIPSRQCNYNISSCWSGKIRIGWFQDPSNYLGSIIGKLLRCILCSNGGRVSRCCWLGRRRMRIIGRLLDRLGSLRIMGQCRLESLWGRGARAKLWWLWVCSFNNKYSPNNLTNKYSFLPFQYPLFSPHNPTTRLLKITRH